MEKSKEKKGEIRDQLDAQGLLRCQICGQKIEAETYNWEEDEGGGRYCQDCRAERQSCGCSD